jgi:hypothetical protein
MYISIRSAIVLICLHTICQGAAPAGFPGLAPEYWQSYDVLKPSAQLLKDAELYTVDQGEREGWYGPLANYSGGARKYIPEHHYGFIFLTKEQHKKLGSEPLELTPEQRLRARVFFDAAIKKVDPDHILTYPLDLSTLLHAYYRLFDPRSLSTGSSWRTLNITTPEARWFTQRYIDALKTRGIGSVRDEKLDDIAPLSLLSPPPIVPAQPTRVPAPVVTAPSRPSAPTPAPAATTTSDYPPKQTAFAKKLKDAMDRGDMTTVLTMVDPRGAVFMDILRAAVKNGDLKNVRASLEHLRKLEAEGVQSFDREDLAKITREAQQLLDDARSKQRSKYEEVIRVLSQP